MKKIESKFSIAIQRFYIILIILSSAKMEGKSILILEHLREVGQSGMDQR